MRLRRLEITPGALLALAALYYLDEDGVFAWTLLACALHEGGHCLAIHWLGSAVVRVRLSAGGAELRMAPGRSLSRQRLALAALAGPAVNLLLALGSALLARRGMVRLYVFAGLNLALAAFNLLPVAWLDGGRVLTGLFARLGWETAGEEVVEICSDAVAALVVGAGLALLWYSGGRSFTLLLAGLWMLAAGRRKRSLL